MRAPDAAWPIKPYKGAFQSHRQDTSVALIAVRKSIRGSAFMTTPTGNPSKGAQEYQGPPTDRRPCLVQSTLGFIHGNEGGKSGWLSPLQFAMPLIENTTSWALLARLRALARFSGRQQDWHS
jgi:hypothetical protein